jgi:nucleolar GTP-binding protein
MNFQGLQSVDEYSTYIDIAFSRAKKKVQSLSLKREKDGVEKARTQELRRIESVIDTLSVSLTRVEESFPSFETLPEFYKELCYLHFDVDSARQSLGALHWAVDQVKELGRETRKNIIGAKTRDKIISYRQAFFGRVNSVMKRINKHLKSLEEIRRMMKAFPSIKEKYLTVAIVGFPNVGKSTLLSKITTSKVEVNSYSFTTKSLLVGYRTLDNDKIQFIDTPGTLNRDAKKNMIEKQAELAMKYVADIMIYVFDPTELYPLEKQEKLLKNVQKFHKDIVLYLSKTDIADPDIIAEIEEKHPGILKDQETLISTLKPLLKKQ